ISEEAHKESKDGFRRSNRTGDWTQQILNRSARKEAFELRQAWLIWHEERINPAEKPPFPNIVPENETPPKAEFRGIRKPLDSSSGRIHTMFEVIESCYGGPGG